MTESGSALIEVLVVGHQESALPARQRLARHNRHCTYMTDRSQKPPLVKAALCMRHILDHFESVFLGDLHNRIHIGGMSAVVDRDDSLGPLGDAMLDIARVHRQCLRVNFGEYNSTAQRKNLQRSTPIGHALRYYFVANTDTASPHRRLNRRGPRIVA